MMASSVGVRPITGARVLGRPSPFVTALVFWGVDTIALLGCPVVALWLWRVVNPAAPDLISQFWPAVILFWGLCGAFGLYLSIGITPIEEFRRVVLATALTYLLFMAGAFVLRDMSSHSRGVFVLAGAFSLLVIPLGRAAVCHFAASRSGFGAPVVILGAGSTGAEVARQLRLNCAIGLKPVAFLDDAAEKWGSCKGDPRHRWAFFG